MCAEMIPQGVYLSENDTHAQGLELQSKLEVSK